MSTIDLWASGLERNTATATSSTTLINPQNATFIATTRVAPILRLSTTASVAHARSGQNVSFGITVTNPTPTAPVNVTRTPPVPCAGASRVSPVATPAC
jgi:uncharacterized repeat protein (TIGR01451 family)